jgi:hypothetical protein
MNWCSKPIHELKKKNLIQAVEDEKLRCIKVLEENSIEFTDTKIKDSS